LQSNPASLCLSLTHLTSTPHLLTTRRSGSGQQQLPSHSFALRHHSKHQNTTPPRHALRPRPTRATTAAAHNCRPPATSRKVCLNHTQSIARLPCLLSAVSRPARPAFRKPALQPIYRQSIRFPCDSLRLLALCTRMPRSPSIRRTIVRGA
jgi:hypothetical protein